MCCWGVQAEHSKSECVFSLHANSSLWRRHSCRLRACVRDSFCIPSQRPTQTPTQNQNSKEIPMSCRFTWRMSIIVAEFPPRFSHTSIHQGCQCNTNGTTTTKKKQGIPFWLWWLYLHGGDSDTRMTNVARLHLAPWQRAVQTFMMQHFKYFLFMTKFLLMSEGHKRKHQSSLAAMIDFFTLTCINRNYLQASYINHASNALSPLAHSSLGRTDYAGCVYIFISVPLLMWIMC